MTSSGTQIYTLNTQQICSEMLDLLQVTPEGQQHSVTNIAKCQASLNQLLKNWRAKFKFIPKSDWINIPLVSSSIVNVSGIDYECIRNHTSSTNNQPGTTNGWAYWKKLASTNGAAWVDTTDYVSICNPVLDDNVIGIGRGFVRTQNDTTVQDVFLETHLSTEDFFYLGNKTAIGQPRQLYFRRRETNSVFLYPYPSSKSFSIQLEVYRQLDDMTDGDNDTELKQEWILAITTNAAVLAHPKFETKNVAQITELKQLAADSLDDAVKLDEESGDIYFAPKMSVSGGRRY